MTTDAGMTIREAVAVFADVPALEAAIDDLESAGFDRAEISLLASATTVEAKLGHRVEKVETLEDDPDVPRAAYVSKEAIGDAEGGLIGGFFYIGSLAAAGMVVATGGTLAATIVAAAMVGGTGGLIGATLAKLVGDHHAQYLKDQLDRGGLLLWVNLRDRAHEDRATEILRRHAGRDVHVHDLPAASPDRAD
jgi:hypothetical protein